MESIFMILLFGIVYLPTLALLAFTPYFTRKSENFGVGTPEELYGREDLKAIRKSYRNKTLAASSFIGILAFALFILIDTDIAVLVYTGGILLMIFVSFIFYLSGHKQVKQLKNSEGWTDDKVQVTYVDTDFRKKRSYVSALWFLSYPLIIAVTILIGISVYDSLPDMIPIHFDAAGAANGWAKKSVKILFLMPATQVFLSMVMGLSFWMIVKSKQQTEASDPKASLVRSRKFRYYWSAFTLFSGAAILIMLAFIHMIMFGILSTQFILPVTFVIPAGMIIASIVLSVRVGQGGSRLTVAESPAESNEGRKITNKDDDKYWKLGVIYYNPDDPALFVEKRFGVGWTFNFARPIALIILAGLVIVLPAAIIIFSVWLSK